MRGHKLHNLKSAMNYLIKKIGSKDRLAVIPFGTDVHKHPFGLSHMSKDGKHRAAGFVHGLEAHGDTNISAALEAGIKALHERTHKDTRAAAVFLMSDGCQNRGGDARNVAGVAHVTVDTFGFGSDHDPKVLAAIATKSLGGTYHYVRDDHGATLTASFSQPLAGLRSVVLLGLKLTLSSGKSSMHRVDAGGYPHKKHADGAVTVDFGHLYRHETRAGPLVSHPAGDQGRAGPLPPRRQHKEDDARRRQGGASRRPHHARGCPQGPQGDPRGGRRGGGGGGRLQGDPRVPRRGAQALPRPHGVAGRVPQARPRLRAGIHVVARTPAVRRARRRPPGQALRHAAHGQVPGAGRQVPQESQRPHMI